MVCRLLEVEECWVEKSQSFLHRLRRKQHEASWQSSRWIAVKTIDKMDDRNMSDRSFKAADQMKMSKAHCQNLPLGNSLLLRLPWWLDRYRLCASDILFPCLWHCDSIESNEGPGSWLVLVKCGFNSKWQGWMDPAPPTPHGPIGYIGHTSRQHKYSYHGNWSNTNWNIETKYTTVVVQLCHTAMLEHTIIRGMLLR